MVKQWGSFCLRTLRVFVKTSRFHEWVLRELGYIFHILQRGLFGQRG